MLDALTACGQSLRLSSSPARLMLSTAVRDFRFPTPSHLLLFSRHSYHYSRNEHKGGSEWARHIPSLGSPNPWRTARPKGRRGSFPKDETSSGRSGAAGPLPRRHRRPRWPGHREPRCPPRRHPHRPPNSAFSSGSRCRQQPPEIRAAQPVWRRPRSEEIGARAPAVRPGTPITRQRRAANRE